MADVIKLGTLVKLEDGAEGIVGHKTSDISGNITVEVLFPSRPTRLVPLEKVEAIGDAAPTPLRAFVEAAQAAVRPPPSRESEIMEMDTLVDSNVLAKKLRAEVRALKAALEKSEASRVDSTKMVIQLRSQFDKIISEVIAENKTLVRAAENSVVTGYKARANQFSRGGDTDIDGRISAAGSFKSADTATVGPAAGASVLGQGPQQYALASD
eukprot:SAG22_NODE_6709_length_821_cov_1.072022_1_plen_211_part_10